MRFDVFALLTAGILAANGGIGETVKVSREVPENVVVNVQEEKKGLEAESGVERQDDNVGQNGELVQMSDLTPNAPAGFADDATPAEFELAPAQASEQADMEQAATKKPAKPVSKPGKLGGKPAKPEQTQPQQVRAVEVVATQSAPVQAQPSQKLSQTKPQAATKPAKTKPVISVQPKVKRKAKPAKQDQDGLFNGSGIRPNLQTKPIQKQS